MQNKKSEDAYFETMARDLVLSLVHAPREAIQLALGEAARPELVEIVENPVVWPAIVATAVHLVSERGPCPACLENVPTSRAKD